MIVPSKNRCPFRPATMPAGRLWYCDASFEGQFIAG
jgi:hypothetical protein